jgi:DNA polymerase III subunit delta'
MVTFKNILSHERQVAWLARTWSAGRLPHALIFAGPAGVGKATTARALGGLFLCERPKDDLPCGGCESCRGISADVHPDFHVIYRQLVRLEKKVAVAKLLSIDVIRQYLIAPANRKATNNHGKVFIIEEAELMTIEAQNALLKTLEEPASRTLIILLTDQPNLLLPTIRSRCQMLRFGLLDGMIVQKELARRGIDHSAAAAAAVFAEGSLGTALVWTEDGVVERAGELVDQLGAVMAGRPPGDLQDWFKKSHEAWAEKAIERDKLASKDQASREGIATYLRIASNHFRRQLSSLGDPEAAERVCAAIDAVVRSEEFLGANVNMPLVIQQFVVSLERIFAPRQAAISPSR